VVGKWLGASLKLGRSNEMPRWKERRVYMPRVVDGII